MASTHQDRPVVLVVDDEPQVAETYAVTLDGEYDTRIVHGGEAALAAMDADVDAVLLDRRMPDLSGDEVLGRIRDRGFDCPVIMTTAVDPDLNILEMDFDDYLCKPIGAETLRETVAQHVDRSIPDPRLEEFFALVAKLDVLEAQHSQGELADHPQYERLRAEADALGAELRESIDDFETLRETYREIERNR